MFLLLNTLITLGAQQKDLRAENIIVRQDCDYSRPMLVLVDAAQVIFFSDEDVDAGKHWWDAESEVIDFFGKATEKRGPLFKKQCELITGRLITISDAPEATLFCRLVMYDVFRQDALDTAIERLPYTIETARSIWRIMDKYLWERRDGWMYRILMMICDLLEEPRPEIAFDALENIIKLSDLQLSQQPDDALHLRLAKEPCIFTQKSWQTTTAALPEFRQNIQVRVTRIIACHEGHGGKI